MTFLVVEQVLVNLSVSLYHVWGFVWGLIIPFLAYNYIRLQSEIDKPNEAQNFKMGILLGAIPQASIAFYWSLQNLAWLDATQVYFVIPMTLMTVISGVFHIRTLTLVYRRLWKCVAVASLLYLIGFEIFTGDALVKEYKLRDSSGDIEFLCNGEFYGEHEMSFK